jgi:hypothetical protein
MDSGGFGQASFAILLGIWSFLILTGLVLASLGAYRKYSGQSWKPFLLSGAVLFFLLVALTLINPAFYLEISSSGWFSLFIRSFILVLPLVLLFFGGYLSLHSPPRLPGILFIAAGLFGVLSCIPFIVDAFLKVAFGDTAFTRRGLTLLSVPYLQQLSLIRMLAETAGIFGLFSYLKHRDGSPPASLPRPEKPLFKES